MTVFIPGVTERDPKRIIQSLQQLASGRSNAVGAVTLVTSSSTTTVSPSVSSLIAVGSVPILTPMSAAAATEQGNGTIFVSAVAAGSFVLTHANSGTTGRVFGWAILG